MKVISDRLIDKLVDLVDKGEEIAGRMSITENSAARTDLWLKLLDNDAEIIYLVAGLKGLNKMQYIKQSKVQEFKERCGEE